MTLDPMTIANTAIMLGGLLAYRFMGSKDSDLARGGARIAAKQVRLIMMVVISLAVLGSSLYILLSGRYDANNQNFAFGIIGTIVGFWLKP